MAHFLKPVLYLPGVMLIPLTMLPLPWPVRIAWYWVLGRLVRFAIGLLPQAYSMLADDGRRYGMGKKRVGQAQSIMAMELVVAELERQQTPAVRVREAYVALHTSGMPPDEIPYGLARALFDAETQRRILRHIRAL